MGGPADVTRSPLHTRQLPPREDVADGEPRPEHPGGVVGQQPLDRTVLRIRIEDRESAVVADVQFEMRVLSDALQRLCALYFSTGVHRNRSLEKAAR